MELKDFLKKTVSFGIGAAAFSAEKIKQLADELVQKGEMTQDEAKKVVDEASKRADEEKAKFQEWIGEHVSKVSKQMSFAKSDDVVQLAARVTALEKRLGITEGCTCEKVAEPEAPSDAG